MPAFGGDLGPGDLEACDSLMGSHPGHAPQEVARDVSLVDGERGRQVLRLRQDLRGRWSWSCLKKKSTYWEIRTFVFWYSAGWDVFAMEPEQGAA